MWLGLLIRDRTQTGFRALGAGFRTQPAVYLELAVKAQILPKIRSAFLCPSAHFNPIAASVLKLTDFERG